MKTRLIIIVLLIACFACSTNNKPVSDAQKEKIKGEVKEVVNTFIKGCEVADFDMAFESFLDSPDFAVLFNGRTYSYKELMDMKPSFNTILNQTCTIKDEKYTVINNSNVVFTSNCKWAVNFKDGHSTLEDPNAFTFILKKIDGKWKVTYYTASYIEKIVKYKEPSNELNQVELMKLMIGYWKCESAKDTTQFFDTKPYGTGLESYYKHVTKGKTVKEGKDLWGYDNRIDKYLWAEVTKGSDIEIRVIWFLTNNKYEVIQYNDISNPEKASWKIEGEFKSPEITVETTIVNNKIVKTETWVRVK